MINFSVSTISIKGATIRQILDKAFHGLVVAPRVEMELPNFTAIKPLVKCLVSIHSRLRAQEE